MEKAKVMRKVFRALKAIESYDGGNDFVVHVQDSIVFVTTYSHFPDFFLADIGAIAVWLHHPEPCLIAFVR